MVQPQLLHFTEIAAQDTLSSGHGIGCGALSGVGPTAGAVQVLAKTPWA